MSPRSGLLSPSATGGDDGPMGGGLAMAAMGLEDHDIAACEGCATDPAQDIVHTLDPTAHERTQDSLRRLITRVP
jgi:hypothetical protein